MRSAAKGAALSIGKGAGTLLGAFVALNAVVAVVTAAGMGVMRAETRRRREARGALCEVCEGERTVACDVCNGERGRGIGGSWRPIVG